MRDKRWYQRGGTVAKIVSSLVGALLVSGIVRYYAHEGLLRKLGGVTPT